jgi:predicted O-methyltransferase YrrM
MDYEELFVQARRLVEPGGLVVADNVLSDVDVLAAYSAARQADPSCVSVTVPLDRGLELTSVLTDPLK